MAMRQVDPTMLPFPMADCKGLPTVSVETEDTLLILPMKERHSTLQKRHTVHPDPTRARNKSPITVKKIIICLVKSYATVIMPEYLFVIVIIYQIKN